MTSGLTTATATSALSRETPTKETPETAETYVEKRLKRLWGEDQRDFETAEVDQYWSVVACMGQWWSEVGAGVEQGHQYGMFGRI
jgi:hypothetical protein